MFVCEIGYLCLIWKKKDDYSNLLQLCEKKCSVRLGPSTWENVWISFYLSLSLICPYRIMIRAAWRSYYNLIFYKWNLYHNKVSLFYPLFTASLLAKWISHNNSWKRSIEMTEYIFICSLAHNIWDPDSIFLDGGPSHSSHTKMCTYAFQILW